MVDDTNSDIDYAHCPSLYAYESFQSHCHSRYSLHFTDGEFEHKEIKVTHPRSQKRD